MDTRAEIARMRAEAKHYRTLAACNRRIERDARQRGDQLGALKAKIRTTELVRAAQQRDARAKELRTMMQAAA
ncbi:hypothetical protein LGM38_14880 [Burkholderia vietnamiensis]|uniref:hypothetical protein n=1 Tax=Burkholderia vietnamiensis TaxID=60552 RepID=UPI001CF11FF5|nr:hypothetical protein [Burkholderia vietnamiensis]MCA8013334.1 hypothetical protein [Burkholderia vietnamiensis]